MKLIVALMIVVGLTACGKEEPQTSTTTQDNLASLKLVVKYKQQADFLLSQCPAGGCGIEQSDIVRQACSSLLLARAAAAQSGNAEVYAVQRNNVKIICGPDY